MSIGSKLCTLATAPTFVFLMPQSASAIGTAAIDGNEVLNRCKTYIRTIDDAQAVSQSDYVDGGFCVGYVTGVIDGSGFRNSFLAQSQTAICSSQVRVQVSQSRL